MLSSAATKPALLLVLLGGLGTAGWATFEALSPASQAPRPEAVQVTGGSTMGGGSVSSNGVGNGVANGNANGAGNGAGGQGQGQGHGLDVTGTVSGVVAPGSPAALSVSITNPNSQAILVTSVTGTVTGVTTGHLVGRPLCDKNWYSLGTWTGSLRLERGASTTVRVPLVLANLADTNQDNCKGATFTYTFSAAAQQA